MPTAKNIFSETEKNEIVKAIQQAELNTSGEIRVHIENNCKGNVEARALKLFGQLKMHATEQRNGVLVYLAVKDHLFAIYGDKGINDMVPEDFWDSIRDQMKEKFTKGLFSDGLIAGILAIGEKLKQYFPYQSDDTNELSDEISFS
jgi:uncharacterized membrane protein